jgi:hypothetical protein
MADFVRWAKKAVMGLGLVLLMGAEGGSCQPPPEEPTAIYNLCSPEVACDKMDTMSGMKCLTSCSDHIGICGSGGYCIYRSMK